MNCDLIAVFASDLRTCERTQRYFTLIHIGYLHISRNAPCLPPKILHKHCLLFLLGLQQYPREIEDNVYAEFWGQTRFIMGDVQMAMFSCFSEIARVYLPQAVCIRLKLFGDVMSSL